MENLGTFKIAEPCHENWNQMTPETQGRFCASCQRCVVDFTQKTPVEMKAIYEQENGNVCGRVRVSQVMTQRPPVRSHTPRFQFRALKAVQMFALALMATFVMLIHTEAKAQNNVVMGKMAYVPEVNQKADIYGRVIDEAKKPVAGAEVLVFHNGEVVGQAVTNSNGMYSLQVNGYTDIAISASKDDQYSQTQTATLRGGRQNRIDLEVYELRIMGEMIFEPEEIDVPETKPLILAEPLPVIERLPIIEQQPESSISVLETVAAPENLSTGRSLSGDEAIELAGFELKAFPNPTADNVTLVIDRVGSERLSVQLIDIGGKVVYDGVWLRFMETRKTIDMADLPAGIYLLQLRAGEQTVRRQLMKI